MGKCSYCWTETVGIEAELHKCGNETDNEIEINSEGVAHVCDKHLERVQRMLEEGSGLILEENPTDTETIH